MSVKRRDFLKKFSLGAATLSTVLARPSVVNAQSKAQKFNLKLTTTWPPKTAILQEAAERFSKMVRVASGGRLRIKVFAGGELIPALGAFDAVSQGNIQMGVGSPYYWAGKVPAAQFFGSMPFGMNAQQFNAWMISGGGQQLWEEIYKPFNLVPFQFGNTGVQTGGWFKKEIKSAADLKGLKIRAPGLGGKVLAKAGANVVLLPGSEVYTSLERGAVDAAEWIGPYHDEKLGLHRAAKFCYYPGWQEPSSNLELTINSKAWGSLPKDLQAIVKAAAADCSNWTLSRSEAENGAALSRLRTKHKVIVQKFPTEVLKILKGHRDSVISELVKADPLSAKVEKAYRNFSEEVQKWSEISEESYSQTR